MFSKEIQELLTYPSLFLNNLDQEDLRRIGVSVLPVREGMRWRTIYTQVQARGCTLDILKVLGPVPHGCASSPCAHHHQGLAPRMKIWEGLYPDAYCGALMAENQAQ